MALSKPVVLVTDCSGMDAPSYCLRSMNVNFRLASTSDTNNYCNRFRRANFPSDKEFLDMMKRDHAQVPNHDLYVVLIEMDLRHYLTNYGSKDFDLMGRANQMLHCAQTSKYCGKCGKETSFNESEGAFIRPC